jgi:hypothetical protein
VLVGQVEVMLSALMVLIQFLQQLHLLVVVTGEETLLVIVEDLEEVAVLLFLHRLVQL